MQQRGLTRRLAGAILGAAMIASLAAVLPAGAQVEPEPSDGGAYAVNETVGRIERAYITLLGRSPDDGGLRYWLDRQADGLEYERIIQFFLDSPERQAKYPAGQTDAEFLQQLYLDAFGRAPDADGAAYWTDQLTSSALTRDEVALFFADSAEQRAATGPNPVFELNIFHINDHHSNLEPDDIDLEFGGVEAETELGGFPRVVAKIDELRAANAGGNNLALHAGDAITGTLYYTLFQGEADAALMNEVCFDAFALGNHEFDGGDAGLVTFLDFLADGSCDTPVLGANVVPQRGTPLDPGDGSNYIQAFTIRNFGSESVGIIGLDIAQKTQVSSSPLDTTQFLDEAETAQLYIDILEGMGVDKIVLLTHYTYANDLELASQITGADLIVGGDSHSLLGDFSAVGLSSAGDYPTQTTDKAGLPVCVVQAWQYSAVVGELTASFDEYGHVASCGGTPHLLVGGDFVDGDGNPLSTADAATIQAGIDGLDNVSVVTPDADAQAVLDGFAADVEVLSAQVIGTATEDLCLARIPGDTGRTDIEACVQGGVPNGGDIQQLVAYAFADRAFDADFALQNSGGVRIDIPAGDITIADAYRLLPFANTMVNLEMTGAEVKQALEDGVGNILDNGGSSGAYPYGAYLRWDMDFTQPAGSRISNIEIRDKADGSAWGPIDPAATYTVVVNSFMAGGGDGYDTLETVFDSGRGVDTFIDYAQGFIDYVVENNNGSVGRVPIDDYSTQNFTPAAD